MATWDQLSLGSWDQLWTWDDPDRDIAIDSAYSMGEVTLDSAELTVDWSGDVPTDLLAPTSVRDDFSPQLAASDSYNRVVVAGIGATDQGTPYATVGGTSSNYGVDGIRLQTSLAATGVQYRIQLPTLSRTHSDITLRFDFPTAPTGSGGVVEHSLRARFVDTSNFLDLRLFRSVNTGQCSIQLRQRVAGVDTTSSQPIVAGAGVTSSVYLRLVARGDEMYGYAWVSGNVSPTTPALTMTGLTGPSSGFFEWYTQLNASITNTLPVSTYYDDLRVLSGDLVQTSVGAHPWTFRNVSPDSQYISVGSDGYAVLRLGAVNTSYIALVNDVSEADFDILVKVRATQFFTGQAGSFVIVARYQGATDYLRFRLDFNTDRVMGYGVDRWNAGSPTTLTAGLFPDFLHTTDGWVYFRAQGVAESLRLKAWSASKRITRGWTAYAEDTLYASVPGKMGFGAFLGGSNTNTLPYKEFQVDQFWMGANSALDSGQVSVGLSLDDGLPNEVTNTSNIGVNETSAELLGPIGTSPDVYFSPFRTDQPLADLPRDTAGVALTAQVLTTSGVRPVRLFTGRMTDIPLDDQSAKMTGISSARLALSAPVQPPAVHGIFEGKEATWLIGYALFKSGLYVAPRPIDGCRIYIPLNGTTHSYIPDANYQAAPFSGLSYRILSTPEYAPPQWIDGPFTAAPDLCINATAVRKITTGPGSLDYAAFGPGDDFLSQACSQGRIEAWIKADPTDVASSLSPTTGDLVRIRLRSLTSSRYAELAITGQRLLKWQGSDGTIERQSVFGDFPTDGRWHYVCVTWDILNSRIQIRLDSKTVATASSLSTANLPPTDDLSVYDMDLCLPTCEIRVASGLNSVKAGFANAMNFASDVVMRRSLLQLEAIAEPTPREAFELISSLAQAELAQLGFDQLDRVNYLPLRYWAESSQQLIQETLSTDSNLGKRFKATSDVHRIYNQVTLAYKQTYVNETWATGFQSSQLVRIDPGRTIEMVAAMSVPIVEVRGLTFSVLQGAALAASPPSVSNAINYITLNLAQDGTGAYALPSDVTISIISWTPGSVTIRIRNNNPQTLYITNNVSIPPLGIAVKQVIIADSTVSATQGDSIAQRGVRNLPVSLNSIQTTDNAGSIAQALVAFLAYPRTTIVSDVWGDFRRTPGQLVRIKDADNTGLDGSFRLTGVTITQDGAEVQQAISAVQAWPVQQWGSGTWGSGIWGSSS